MNKLSRIILALVMVLTVALVGGSTAARADDEHDSKRSSEHRRSRTVEIEGTITSLTSNTIVVDGKTIVFTRNTEIEGRLTVGAYVEVEAIWRNSSLIAREIEVEHESSTPPPPPPSTNQPPVLNTIGNKTVNEGQLLTFTLSANDPDGNTLTYSAANIPSGSGFNPATRVFSWTPGFTQAGSYPAVHFQVSDGTLIASEDITITVGNVNRAPVLNAIGNKSVSTGALLTFTISATDTDGDALTYSAANLPSGSGFNPATRVFSWTPNSTQTGTYPAVHFQVSDGSLTASEDITITVGNVNRAPVLGAIGNKSVNEGQLLTITLSATDPDGNTLTYSAANIPSGSGFNATTGVFSWTPGFTQAGTYPAVHFQVSDGSLIASEDITITVVNVNRAPVLNAIGNKSVNEGQLLTITLSATDPDGNTLTYSAASLPSGSGFNATTGVFSWTPGFTQAGIYPAVHFQVSDGSLIASEDITITVTPAVQLVSFSATIQPMLNSSCSGSWGCHITGGVSPLLNNYNNVYSARNSLPGMGVDYLTDAQEQALADWISQGALNN